jgi:hypothetical protein
MKTFVRDNWANWLDEHRDQQGQGQLAEFRLNDDNETVVKYCCLGGLCEMAVAAGVCLRKVAHGSNRYTYGTADELDYEGGEAYLLPLSVMNWAGLNSQDPALNVICVTDTKRLYNAHAAHCNDDKNYTFDLIAELVRRLPGE